MIITNPSSILVVDDNAVNHIVLNDLIITLGHTPILAENGLSALKKMEKGTNFKVRLEGAD